MRVLWFSCSPACYDIVNYNSWVEALEKIVRTHLSEIELGIAFEHTDKIFKVIRNGVTYYPVCYEQSPWEKLRNKFHSSARLKAINLNKKYEKVIEDFKPDIIQCFGTELWHYSILQQIYNIPFIIHLMGFWNVINLMSDIASRYDAHNSILNPNKRRRIYIGRKNLKEHEEIELETMSCCHYFMGRTEWDKAIVRHFSPNATYYHCPEAIREEIYSSPIRWKYRKDDIIRLVTVSNASIIKGNEIMLRAASILKQKFGKEVAWKITAMEEEMKKYESMTGIKCADVGIIPIGRISASELPDTICSAEMFVHCAIIDNSPNAICEAQLLGCPVIATNAGGIPQIVSDGETGILYPYAEPYALAFRIMELHNNERELNRLSQNEWEMSHLRHNPETIAKRLKEIYLDCINHE